MSPDDSSSEAQARRQFHTELAERFGNAKMSLRKRNAVTTMFKLADQGDMVLRLRLNRPSAARVAAALECGGAMLEYCAGNGLAPSALVITEASGACA